MTFRGVFPAAADARRRGDRSREEERLYWRAGSTRAPRPSPVRSPPTIRTRGIFSSAPRIVPCAPETRRYSLETCIRTTATCAKATGIMKAGAWTGSSPAAPGASAGRVGAGAGSTTRTALPLLPRVRTELATQGRMLGAPPGRACRLPGVPQAAQRTRCGTVHGVRTGSHPFPASCSRTHRAVRRTGLARRERDPGYADPPRSLPDPLEQGAPRRCSRLRPAYRRAPGGVGASGGSPGHGRPAAARGERPHRTRPTERSHRPRAPGAGAAHRPAATACWRDEDWPEPVGALRGAADDRGAIRSGSTRGRARRAAEADRPSDRSQRGRDGRPERRSSRAVATAATRTYCRAAAAGAGCPDGSERRWHTGHSFRENHQAIHSRSASARITGWGCCPRHPGRSPGSIRQSVGTRAQSSGGIAVATGFADMGLGVSAMGQIVDRGIDARGRRRSLLEAHQH